VSDDRRLPVAGPRYAQNQTPDAPQVLRDVAEKSTAQAKDTFEQMSVGNSAAFKGTQDYSAKVFEFANANINAA
jgi:hypothetical protein